MRFARGAVESRRYGDDPARARENKGSRHLLRERGGRDRHARMRGRRDPLGVPACVCNANSRSGAPGGACRPAPAGWIGDQSRRTRAAGDAEHPSRADSSMSKALRREGQPPSAKPASRRARRDAGRSLRGPSARGDQRDRAHDNHDGPDVHASAEKPHRRRRRPMTAPIAAAAGLNRRPNASAAGAICPPRGLRG